MSKGIIDKEMRANHIIPGTIFHPGDFIAEEMKSRGMKQVELAEELGLSKSEMSMIIKGKVNITVCLALKLEKVLGISAETWINFQMGYKINLIRKYYLDELEKTKVSAKKKAALRRAIANHS